MADDALFFGWGEVVRGRETKAVEVFNEAVAYYGQLQQAGKIEAVVGVQMRQQDVHRVRIGMALQRTEHASAEIEHQRRRVGRGDEVSGRRRIWTDNTAGTTEYGDSHAH